MNYERSSVDEISPVLVNQSNRMLTHKIIKIFPRILKEAENFTLYKGEGIRNSVKI